MPDVEIDAMAKVADALGSLQDEERARILRWAAERYGVTLATPRKRSGAGHSEDGEEAQEGESQEDDDSSGRGEQGFEHFAELYEAAHPSSDPERALVASYWVQVIQGKATFGSLDLNKVLKDLGHGIGTINHAMSANIQKKPALILQVARGGSARQARKKYKLTDAGKKWVAARLQ